MLQADNVSFGYGKASQGRPEGRPFSVLDNVSLTIPLGGLVGILGPNGSGKTTLLRLLSGTRRPASGRVLLDGRPLDRLSRRDAARRIAVVPQETEMAFEYRARDGAHGPSPHLGLFELEGPDDSRSRAKCCAPRERRGSRIGASAHSAAARSSGGDRRGADKSSTSCCWMSRRRLSIAYQLEVAALLSDLNAGAA